MQAKGTFEITMQAEPPYDEVDGVTLGRIAFEKTFTGDLVGTSRVNMLGARTPDPSSAGYVALERVVATLGGRHGTFVLQHSGSMSKGTMSLHIDVVPGSGTGELVGIAGDFHIDIVDGQHHWSFDYTLA